MEKRDAKRVDAAVLTFEPGNGTRYRLFVAQDAQGGALWAWLEGAQVYASGWYGDEEVRVSFPPRVKGRRSGFSDEDYRAVREALMGSFEAQRVLTPPYRWMDAADFARCAAEGLS